MKTVKEAQNIILANVDRLEAEDVSIMEALGRVLAEDITSNRDHPPYDISAMDGYALRYGDVKSATKANPAELTLVDDIRAGMEAKTPVKEGAAARIMTGAPIPQGADTVVRVEDTDTSGDKVKIFDPAKKGANVRLIAMVKKSGVPVYKKPSIAILSTGDELEGLDESFDERKIPDANSYSVMAQLQRLELKPELLGIARDTRAELEDKLKKGLGYNILIVSGGVSVGHHDFVRPTLKALGIEMLFWRVALRPGHPFAFGVGEAPSGTAPGMAGSRKRLVFGLPGNPVSSMVCCEEFIVPAVRKMMGAKSLYRSTIEARLSKEVKDKLGRLHFVRVRLEKTPDGFVAHPTGPQGSGILMSMVSADALMKIGIVTVSDRAFRGEYEDRSGPAVRAELEAIIKTPWEGVFRVVPDESEKIEAVLKELSETVGCSLVITTGGTGPASRDITPDATVSVCEKILPGMGELMRKVSLKKVPTAILSRQTAGIRGTTLIINLPGKPSAISECLRAVFPAVPDCIDLLGGPELETNPDVIKAHRPHKH
jgi:molybdopterin molybdotransferase